jgi:hypothetical protein
MSRERCAAADKELILLQPNTKRREPEERYHARTMVHRKPVKVSNE